MTGFWQSLITTATEVYEPNDGWGLAGLLVIGLPALVTAAGTMWVLIRQRGVRAKVDEVAAGVEQTNKQVVNGHAEKDPLRSDVDKLLKMAEETSAAVGKVHTAVTAETAARKTAIEGINDRLGGIEEHLRAR